MGTPDKSKWRNTKLQPKNAKRVVREYVESHVSRRALALKYGTYLQEVDRVLCEAGVELQDGRRRRGEAHPNYRTGGWTGPDGYRRVLVPPDSPFASMRQSRGHVLEHRLVMATKLRRPLFDYERVHHKNGTKDDNRIENLELWEETHPPGQRNGEATHQHCPTCTCAYTTSLLT